VRCDRQPLPNRILFDIPSARLELLEPYNLHLIETPLPNFPPALEAKRKSALDKLHGLFQRNVWPRRKEQVHMVGHNHEGMQRESPLNAITLNHIQQQIWRTLYLK